MQNIEQSIKFDKFLHARGKIFAILSQEEVKREEEAFYVAKAVEITAEEKANPTKLKAKLYTEVADPIFFKSQRGEATKKEWEDVVAQIRTFTE
jgi:hypothetical protein